MGIIIFQKRKFFKMSIPIQLIFKKSGTYKVPPGYNSMDVTICSSGTSGCPAFYGTAWYSSGGEKSQNVGTYTLFKSSSESISAGVGNGLIINNVKINLHDNIKINIGPGGSASNSIYSDASLASSSVQGFYGGNSASSIYINDILTINVPKTQYGWGVSGTDRYFNNRDARLFQVPNLPMTSSAYMYYGVMPNPIRLGGASFLMTTPFIYDGTRYSYRVNFHVFDDPNEPLLCYKLGTKSFNQKYHPDPYPPETPPANSGNPGSNAHWYQYKFHSYIVAYHTNGAAGVCYLRLYTNNKRNPEKYNKQYFDEHTIIYN